MQPQTLPLPVLKTCTTDWVLYKQHNVFLTVLGAGNQVIRVPAWCLLLGCRLLTVSSHGRASYLRILIRMLIPFAPMPYSPPKGAWGWDRVVCKFPTWCLDLGQVFHSFNHSTSILLNAYNILIPGAENMTVHKVGQIPLSWSWHLSGAYNTIQVYIKPRETKPEYNTQT